MTTSFRHFYVLELMSEPLILVCEGCGTRAEFGSPEQAFNEGWDCPPMFAQVVTCSRCSSAEVLTRKMAAQRSPCCKAPVEVMGDTTLFYACTSCGTACDPISGL